MNNETFEPRIAAFLCNWCSYGAADLAGVSRMPYPANIRIIRIPCTGSMKPDYILQAFRRGVDGVWVSG
jgi:coenzyme F420-reducing hydrogenase delta subunit